VRVGVHVGPVEVVRDPITENTYGTTVNYASRVMQQAVGSGIWVSDTAHAHVMQELADQHRSLRWQRHPDLSLKGFSGLHVLWSIDSG